jgi:HD-GYP domain-containing protein (c-di-GMP phosphodiesterase class II)
MTDRQNREAYRPALHTVAAAAVIVLLVATVATLSFLTYRGTRALLQDNATVLAGQIQGDLSNRIQQILGAANAELDVLVHSDLPLATEITQRLAEIPLLLSTLADKPLIDAAYVGYADGSFILFRPLPDDRAVAASGAPPGSALLAQSITLDDGGNAVGEYRYFDRDSNLLRLDARPDYAFDPRQRPWYGAAQRARGTVVTDPYVFFTGQAVGTTVARRTPGNVAVAGVDVALATLAAALQRLRMTPSTELAILGPNDRVVGYHDVARLVAARADGSLRLPSIAEVGAPALERAASLLGPAGGVVQSEVDGRNWQLMGSALAVQGQAYRLLLAVPSDELFAGAYDILRRQGIAAIGILVVAVAAGWWAAHVVARPIRQLAREANSIGSFDFRRGVKVSSAIQEVSSLAEALDAMKSTIRRFIRIGQVIATERHLPALLDRVLAETIRVSDAIGGAIYLLDDEGRLAPRAMRWKGGEKAGNRNPLPPLSPTDPTMPQPVAEMLATSTSTIRDWTISGEALEAMGFRPPAGDVSGHAFRVVGIPFRDRSEAAIGILLAILPDRSDRALEGREHLKELLTAVASSAAIAIENQQLFQGQKDLMAALIKLIAGAIDAKSAHTAGHCQRVPVLTTMLAEAACAATEGPFADFQLSSEEWEAVEIAAWLHDCGKVTTPEFVVDKATKLETIYDRLHEIRMRFEVLKRDAEVDYWRSLALGDAEEPSRARRDAAWRTLDEDFAFVGICNGGGEHLGDDQIARLRQIGARSWTRTIDDRIGLSQEERARRERLGPVVLPVDEALLSDSDHHVSRRKAEELIAEENAWGIKVKTPPHKLNRGELYNLTVRRGTLTEEERYIINDHMTQTIKMLQSLPFPKHLRAVPEIAGGHHERMDGTGYPKRLTRDQMSPVARMMAIADVFEALTAGDRPYKKLMPVSDALRIMANMKRDHHLDPDLLELFVRSEVWRTYAERFLTAEQIDTPDLDFVLSMRPAGRAVSGATL